MKRLLVANLSMILMFALGLASCDQDKKLTGPTEPSPAGQVTSQPLAKATTQASSGQSYITVVVADDESDPDNAGTSFTITWSDANNCATDYNAYITYRDNDSLENRTLIGSAASDGTQISQSLSNLQASTASIGFDVELYCGTHDPESSQNLVSSVEIPRRIGWLPLGSPVPGTYSSEPPPPALTSLTVSPGTLTPAFHTGTRSYTVPDVPNANDQITVHTTVETGYNVVFVKNSGGVFRVCFGGPSGIGECVYSYGEGEDTVIITDDDPNTPGFQIHLNGGENRLAINVYQGRHYEYYRLKVTRDVGDGSPNNLATGRPTITISGVLATGRPGRPSMFSGVARRGQTLTASTSSIADTDGLTNATFSYQWIHYNPMTGAKTNIAGATDPTYTVTPAERGDWIQVQVSFTDDAGNQETLISSFVRVQGTPSSIYVVNSPATGAPAISGTVQVGQTLTASTSGIADANGLIGASFSYQWVSNDGTSDTDISGATSATYTLVEADEGKTIKVRVSFLDDDNHEETLVSAATATVEAALTSSGTTRGGSVNPNSPATGSPAISGTAQVGQTLTASTSGIADADGLSKASFSYQWVSNDGTSDTDISGATSATYTLVEADEGNTIKVKVSFTDDEGNEESLTSTATGEVAAKPNSPATGQPAISGTAQVGETLTASTSGIADTDGLGSASFSYQWVSNDGTSDTDISGATSATYTLVEADEGNTIKVKVSFTDDAGNEESLTSAATGEVAAKPNSPATGQPAISGTAQVGETLTASTSGIADADGLSNASFSYQWVSNDGTSDTDISGATSATYTLVEADEGNTIKVRVSFTDDAGHAETRTSEPTAEVATVEPLTAEFENTPASHNGTDTFRFRVAFSEALGISYKTLRDHSFDVTDGSVTGARRVDGRSDLWEITVEPDSNADVTVVLPATDDCDAQGAVCTSDDKKLSNRSEITVPGPEPVNSPATGAPAISGTAQVGETLTASTSGITDTDGLSNASFSYQWVSNDGTSDTDISGATSATYTLVEADEGKTIKVKVSFTDDADYAETRTSTATGEVAARPNSPATGAPAIGGTAQVGETLTASTSGITDTDGLSNASFSYQWVSNDGTSDTDISGATSATYTLVEADEGNTIKVRVSFTDDAGHAETRTSAATGEVAARPNPQTLVEEEDTEPQEPPPAPQNLTSTVNSDGSITLTWDAPDDDSVSGYQILRRRPTLGENTLLVHVEDTGSTATTYTDTDVTAGARHVYRVKAINSAGLSPRSNYTRAEP